ncbi:MAG: SUMF1/EgtB/PvdO family nonheme iron enzyme [Bryobacterales bacterium]|nr:SUMF1/EgtB/PvdO family nonheme iron enzyme [Bryobacterales bacterium]
MLSFPRRLTPAGQPGSEPRVLRGGSWINNQSNARAGYRNHNHPHNRNNNIGFRVGVLFPHPPSVLHHAGLSRRLRLPGMRRSIAGWRGPVLSARRLFSGGGRIPQPGTRFGLPARRISPTW